MTTQPDYSKIYTHAPEQHPNLILGSLQLLFWCFYRPSALQKFLVKVDPALHPNFQSSNRLQWRKIALWKLFIQAFLVLPLLFNFPLHLLLSLLNDSVDKLIINSAIAILMSSIYGVCFGVNVAISFGLNVCLFISIAFAIALN